MNITDLSVTQLRELAKERGLKGISALKKDELISLLENTDPIPVEDKTPEPAEDKKQLFDVNKTEANVNGILEVLADGYGFARGANCLDDGSDVYVSPAMIRKYSLKTGDKITGYAVKREGEKFEALIYIKSVNDERPDSIRGRKPFESLIPVYPDERLRLETDGKNYAMRIVDLISPVGKGQRGLIVAPPKAGKTTLLKQIAKSMLANNKDIHMIVLLIDERPEEVTDMQHSIEGADVVYSTFDMPPENHAKVAELVLERAQRLVEHGKD
ncbi:MAG: Rho termination factor N-terminal domain-containing protein, partial [Oscillospiraceae bacterium]|nr:Rho termination factor N-terminal domain-containing protein [Oscillospiraceae bacterium]